MPDPVLSLTPMMRQYVDIKQRYQDAILFFRMGDFYEMFFEDAQKASSMLEIVLTHRNKGEEQPIPFCGVPHHSAASYIAKLIQFGQKVAICEQVEDPKTAKGIVKREVVRVITPGLVLENESLEPKGNNYLVSVVGKQDGFALAHVDITTGEIGVFYFVDFEGLLAEVVRKDPKEFLFDPHLKGEGEKWKAPWIEKLKVHFPRSLFQTFSFSRSNETYLEGLGENFQKSWNDLNLSARSPLGEEASLRLLAYLRQTVGNDLKHLQRIHWGEETQFLRLDPAAVRNLELVKNQRDGTSWGTLFWLLDQTKTPMGARRLKQWILYPLYDIFSIRIRQKAIGELLERFDYFIQLQEKLASLSDLERQNGRVATGVANSRDLLAIGKTLQQLPMIQELIQNLREDFFQSLLKDWKNLESLAERILTTLVEEPPLTLKEGGMIRAETDPELQELVAILKDGKNLLEKMEEKERERTGIYSLKVRFNRVFGYYIEVPHSKTESVPADYHRKQTLANAERYITPELKTYEEKVLGAEERICQLEYEIFLQLRQEVSRFSKEIFEISQKISDLDAIVSLAQVAQENSYSLPEIEEGEELEITEGRHPVLEKLFPSSRFVPNDLLLNSADCRLILLTGPNMAGKSTLLRQTALIALMAHVGSYVPAKQAKIGLIDQIFTRIGASDDLAKNQSTFWVEMSETAQIVRAATHKSLIVLDEIGRGTSTYDGLSLAWGLAEHFHDQIRAKTIFATHYHELTVLSEKKEGIKNFHVAVQEWNGKIVFLYRLMEGAVHQSYGIQVAALAGVPEKVVERAKEVLKDLQSHSGNISIPSIKENSQLPLFIFSPKEAVLEELSELDLNQLTPLDALHYLYQFQEKLKK